MSNSSAQKQAPAPPDPDAVVPQLQESQITYRELETAVRVLNAVGSLNREKKRKQQQTNNNPKNGKEAKQNPNGNNSKDSPSNNNTNDEQQTDEDDDGLERYKHTNLRPFRKSLAACLELHKRTMYEGKSEDAHYEQRLQQRSLKRQKMNETAAQRKYLETTALRKGRLDRLRALQDDAKQEEENKQAMIAYMVPDGHVETDTAAAASNNSQRLLQNGPANGSVAASKETESKETTTNTDQPPQQQLPKLRSCYVCKVRFRELHHFYDQLCPDCATLNWTKRHQTCDLTGCVAVVTGSRVKIGLQTCLKLLRAGCTVVATTRFPNAAAAVYQQQADFDEWKDRLQVYGLDLRDVAGLEAFTRYLKSRYGTTGIDILINNACQTIRRPAQYYKPVVEQEQTLWQQATETHKALLADCLQLERARRQIWLDQQHTTSGTKKLESGGSSSQHLSILPAPAAAVESGQADANIKNLKVDKNAAVDGDTEMMVEDKSSNSNNKDGDDDDIVEVTTVVESSQRKNETATTAPFESTGISHSAAMSQMVILPEDAGVSDSILPPGVTDINGQQLDLRTSNSWLLKMEQVSTPEIMECMLVNAIAPFVLNSRLKPLMTTPADNSDDNNGNQRRRRRPDRYIINVSAMEGKFYRYKMPCHPHTNMAKAALNMLTRTSAEDLAKKHRIYMNSVDTGWINDENPLERASRTAEKNSFQTPIDEIDAAARILDPVFVGVQGQVKKEYGKFLKDYRETEW